MSLQSRLASLITGIGSAFKADRARLSELEARIVDRHVLSSAAVETHNSNGFSTKIDETITVVGGTYSPTVSYSYNHNNLSNNDFLSRFSIDGQAMHTAPELHRQEVKDVAGQFGTTGSNQTYGFTRVLDDITLTAGEHQVLLEWGGTDTANSSMWDAVVTIERTSL